MYKILYTSKYAKYTIRCMMWENFLILSITQWNLISLHVFKSICFFVLFQCGMRSCCIELELYKITRLQVYKQKYIKLLYASLQYMQVKVVLWVPYPIYIRLLDCSRLHILYTRRLLGARVLLVVYVRVLVSRAPQLHRQAPSTRHSINKVC